MAITERLELYKKLEGKRNRPLIVYITSARPGLESRISVDAIPELLDQLQALPSDAKAVDLLVVSNGGDPTVAWRAMTLLRERVKEVAVLVPQAAYSAATLLALGANEIVMHPNGNLGPVDPQIEVRRKTGPNPDQTEQMKFGFEELAGFLEFAKKEVGLTDQQHLGAMFELFCKQVGPVPVGVAARSSLLSLTMGEKLLRMHMTGEADATKARSIANALNKDFFHHGYPVGRGEAKQIGLNVAAPNPEVEGLMWSIWQDVETELKIREPFAPIFELMRSTAAATLLRPVKQLNLPPNSPPQLAQQILQQAAAGGVDEIDPVDFEVIPTIMESTRLSSREIHKGKILACRLPDLNVRVNVVMSEQGWKRHQ